MKLATLPNLSGGGSGGGASPGMLMALSGRLLCDTYVASHDLVKEVDFTLKTLSRTLLEEERHELSSSDVPGADPPK